MKKSEFNPTENCTIRKAYHGNGKIDLINYIAYMRMHHKYMFDEENIVNILKKVNFSEVELASFDERYDDIERMKESLYVTSVKHHD